MLFPEGDFCSWYSSDGLAWSQRGGAAPRWIPPGRSQRATYLTLTTLPPPPVNQVDGDQHYCWSKHFSGTLISFLFSLYCIINGIIWKQYLSAAACAVPVKDEILALNPPVSTQDGRSAACFPFVLAYIGICLYALLHVKVWNWPQRLGLSRDYFPPERWNGHPHISQRHFCWQ